MDKDDKQVATVGVLSAAAGGLAFAELGAAGLTVAGTAMALPVVVYVVGAAVIGAGVFTLGRMVVRSAKGLAKTKKLPEGDAGGAP